MTGLAHTRLSIIDLTADGRQPMRSDDGRFAIAYNGEVYNFPALRRSLEEAGHRFRGRSDTEVVLHAFMEWGERAFPMLEGMFAMAVWDDREKRLHLARDRFGIKPLYYWAGASSFVFGSEIKALLASGEVAPRVDWHGLHEYLYYNTALGARTLYAGVSKLLPGHKLTLDAESGLNIGRTALYSMWSQSPTTFPRLPSVCAACWIVPCATTWSATCPSECF